MKKIILVCTGMPVSGKTSHTDLIEKRLGIPYVETGHFVYKAVEEANLPPTPENIKSVVAQHKKSSDAYFTEKAIEHMEQLESPVVFITGIKAISELETLHKHYGRENVITFAFHASVNTRYNRLFKEDRVSASEERGDKRTEDIALQDFSNFKARDDKELGYGTGDVIASADYIVNTEDKIWPYHDMSFSTREFEEIVIRLAGHAFEGPIYIENS
ncbi:MAG: AAA family ATPase [Candidatus Heimdallarchaeota archaeon]|nr:AAA family ATPase [Candidatus Heimdallarchaeota archaeon]MCK5049769.1 AAA family ATPase [Candidatus Heimdallarchaeota archaeon]